MSASEAARHALYARLEEVLGDSHAATLMTYLPPEEGTEVATKHDVAAVRDDIREVRDELFAVRDELKADVARIEDRLERFEERIERRIDSMHRTYLTATVGSMTALTAIFSLIAVFWS